MRGLMQISDALADDSISTSEIIARHFNKDNLLDFYAGMYLMDSVDSQLQNYAIYTHPGEPDRAYFVPWDQDGALDWYSQGATSTRERWRYGFHELVEHSNRRSHPQRTIPPRRPASAWRFWRPTRCPTAN